jgi:hypothetical protein
VELHVINPKHRPQASKDPNHRCGSSYKQWIRPSSITSRGTLQYLTFHCQDFLWRHTFLPEHLRFWVSCWIAWFMSSKYVPAGRLWCSKWWAHRVHVRVLLIHNTMFWLHSEIEIWLLLDSCVGDLVIVDFPTAPHTWGKCEYLPVLSKYFDGTLVYRLVLVLVSRNWSTVWV